MFSWATLCPLLSPISPCSYAPLCSLEKNLNWCPLSEEISSSASQNLLPTTLCHHGSTLSLPELTEQSRRWKEEPWEPHHEQSLFQDGHTVSLGFTPDIKHSWVTAFPLQNFLNVNLNLWGYRALCFQNSEHCSGQEWVPEQHMEDSPDSQYS